MEDDGDQNKAKGGFSFSFAKKKEPTKQLEVKSIGEVDTSQRKTETDFILSVDENKVTSVIPKEKPKQLVIPLIQRNKWQAQPPSDHHEQGQKRPAESSERKSDPVVKKMKDTDSITEAGDSLESEAVKEIMKDVSRYNDDWEGRGNEDLNMTIPLLMQNKVPEGFETDDRLDVSIRPDAASDANYEEVPIEQFGMAMLRGMGWNEDGIGNKMKRVVDPVEVVVRPKGQGLGADRRPGDELGKKRQPKRKPGDPAPKQEEEPKGFAKGVPVLVVSGPHKNLYGQIEGVDEDTSRVVIKFALNGQSATLSQFAVQMVTKEDYKKYSKDLGKFSRGHEELKKREEDKSRDSSDSERRKHRHKDSDDRTSERDDKHSRHGRSDRDKSSKYSDRDEQKTEKYDKRDDQNGERQRDRHRHSDEERYRDKRSRGHDDRHRRGDVEDSGRHSDKRQAERRREDRSDSNAKKQRTDHDRASSNDAASSRAAYWLHPDLRVRFIDASYKKGKYYNVKVKVIDVITRDTCTCQTDEGRYLEDIDQSMLETLIPKSDPAYIKVVSGKLKGQLGTVLKRDKVNCRADVQLLTDRETIVKMDYETICEYAGNIQDEEDY